jgi:long-chain fatty acid transport protein
VTRLPVILAAGSILLAAQSAWGSAFAINELGVRAQGMGGAFTSIADDGSALYFNPAGIAFQRGLKLEMDALAVVGLFRFTPSLVPPGTTVPEKGYSGSVKPHFIPVANLYLSKDISSKFTFGFGVMVPFGLSANFTNFNDGDPTNTKFVGRFNGTRARLESYWFQPTLAWRLTENSAVAVGPALVHTHLFYEQSILNPLDDGKTFGQEVAGALFPGQNPVEAANSIARLLPEGRFRLAGTSNSLGFAAGYIYKNPRTKTNFGFSYRSSVNNHLKGNASFAFTSTGAVSTFFPNASPIPSLFPNQAARGSLTTPATYMVGVSNSSFHNMLVAFDVEVQDFDRFASLPINFTINAGTATPPERRIVFDFRNSYIVHAGVEKPIKKDLVVRAGYVFDHSPVPDKSTGPLFPDNTRNSFTVGATKIHGNAEFSAFYQAMFFLDRNTNVLANKNEFTNGLYHNFADLAGVSLRINVGGSKSGTAR